MLQNTVFIIAVAATIIVIPQEITTYLYDMFWGGLYVAIMGILQP